VLALKAQLDLLAIPAGPKGVEAGRHAIHQHPGRGVIDALKRGLQLGPARVDLPQEPEGIELIPRHAREVIEDDVGWPHIGKLGQHPLKRGTPHIYGGLAGLDVLPNDPRTEALCVTPARLPLSLNGIPSGLYPVSWLGLETRR
jgi:hypothetical protein